MPVLLSPMTPVEQIPFTFVDVETTGLDPALGHRVCEIALLRVQGRALLAPSAHAVAEAQHELARFETLVQPQRAMTASAMAVNGITDVMLAGAPPFSAILPHLQPLLQDAVLVAHNAPFDVNFLRHEYALAGQHFPLPAIVDTLALAQAHYRFAHNSLEAIATTLGLPSAVRHRAMADVLTTRQVLACFIADMQQHGPVLLAHLMHPADRRSVEELAALSTTLQEALQTGKLLQLRYQAGNAAETNRVVQPLELCYERGRGYLRAFCHLRQDERNFRFDRIVALHMLTELARPERAEE